MWATTIPLPVEPAPTVGEGTAALWATLGVLITALAGVAIAWINSSRKRNAAVVDPFPVETLRTAADLFDDVRHDIEDVRSGMQDNRDRLNALVKRTDDRAARAYERLDRVETRVEALGKRVEHLDGRRKERP